MNQLVLCKKEIDSLLQAICDIATQSECFKVVCVVRPDEQGEASVLAFSGPEGCENGFPVSFHKVCDEKANSFTRAWHERRIIIDNTFDENCREEEKVWAKKYELSFHAVLPIYLDNKVWGLLSIYDDRVQKYFEDKFELLLNEIVSDVSCAVTELYVRHIQELLFNNRVVGVLLVKENVVQHANIYATEILCTSLEGIVNSSIEQFCFDRTDFQRILEVEQDLCSDECIKVPGVLINRQDGQLMIADFSGTRLSTLAEDLTLWAIENVTYRQLAEFFYKALLEVSDMILRATAEEEICSRACAGLSYNTFFHTVWIGRCDYTEEKLVTIAASGAGVNGIDQVSATTGADGFFVPVQAWKQKKVFYRNDKTLSSDNHNETTCMVDNSWRSVLSAPIWRDGQLWGVVTFVSAYPNVFKEESIIMCKRIASLIGHALEKLEYQQYIRDMQAQEALRARRDLLTGLPNRLALTEYLPQAFARARRYDTLVAVGVFDLDDFKQVNDIWGHTAGDALLRGLADRIQKTMRETDFIVRMGGDEFVIVFEGLSQTNFMLQITRALEHLHVIVETPFNVAENVQATVGMTMGVAFFPSDGVDGDALLRLADAAMYRSKKEKVTRKQWWYLASTNATAQENEKAQLVDRFFDAYGLEAQGLLAHFKVFLNKLAQDFVKHFYDVFSKSDAWNCIFMSLSPRDITWLKHYQKRHVHLLLSPTTTREEIKRAAVKLGIMCFLSGVDAALLTEAYSLFRRLLIDYLNKAMLRATDRYHILLITEIRLQDDKGTLLETAHAVEQEYLNRLVHLPDSLEEILVTLGRLPGMQAVILFRVNAEGELVAKRGAGPNGETCMSLLNSEHYRPTLDENKKIGSSLAVLAWKTGKIQTSSTLVIAPWMEVWRDIALRLRIYSAVSIPVLEENGKVVAVISMYGRYSGQFESLLIQQFNQSLQHKLGMLWSH
ncbi:MAG: diguanylate cyclase, partial [Acetobacter sp.]|nr:diguanylate cyclase [Acetobacter sp.]